jgi:hypothetical protein
MSGQGRSTGPIYIEASAVRAVRSAGYKLIRYPDGRVEFYDLASDATESRPLDCDETCRELSAELDLLIELAASWKDDPGGLSVELDEADLERLRALGYMND